MKITWTKFSVFKAESWPWKQHFNIDDFLTLNMTFLRQSACWPIDFTPYLPERLAILSYPLQLLHFFGAIFLSMHLAALFLYTFLVKIFYRDDTTKLTDISDCMIQFIIYSFTFITLVYYRCRHEKCAEMMTFMNRNFKRRSAMGKTYITTEPCYLLARQITTIWWCMLLFGVVSKFLEPIYMLKWQLPLPQVVYPFDYNSNVIIFVLTFASQSLGQITVGYVFTNFENMLVSTAVLTCGQFDILFCDLKNIRYTAMLMNSMENRKEIKISQKSVRHENEEISQYYYSFEQMEDLDDLDFIRKSMKSFDATSMYCGSRRCKDTYLMEYSRELSLALRACIHHHNIISEMHKLMEDFFNPLILLSSFQITLQICNLAYVSSKPASAEENIQNLQYLALTLVALMMIGYSGNCLKAQSDRIIEALRRCPWHLCGGPFRRDILMIMANTMKPMVLTGGKFFVMDYEEVKAIISASFSYYTLLQKIG